MNASTSGLMSGLTSGGTIVSILDTFLVSFLVGVKFGVSPFLLLPLCTRGFLGFGSMPTVIWKFLFLDGVAPGWYLRCATGCLGAEGGRACGIWASMSLGIVRLLSC